MNSCLDLFKLCKLPDLKELEKKGQVTVTHEKSLGRKVLSVQGNVSTANYVKLNLAKTKVPLNHRYLYLQCIGEPGHTFGFQLTVHSNGRIYKMHFSSIHKAVKQQNANTVNLPLTEWPHTKWTILVIDLHQSAQELISPNEVKLSFELAEVEFRATMRVKGVYLGHQLWSVEELPKDLALPLHGSELFFDKYAFTVVNANQLNQNFDSSNRVSAVEQKKKAVGEVNKPFDNAKQSSRRSRHRSNTKEDSSKKPTSTQNQQDLLKKSKSSERHVTFSDQIPKEESKGIEQVPKPTKVTNRPPKQPHKTSKPSTAGQDKGRADADDGMMEVALMQPKPSPTLEASLLFHCGAKVAIGNYYTLGRYLFTPEPVETHKQISTFKQLSANVTILAYEDGTVAYFNTMMKDPLKYFQTGLQQVTGLYPDKSGVLMITGRDYMRRNVLMVVSDNSILNKQISNYDIKDLLLLNEESYTHGLLTFGFQNVRIWKVKKEVLSGSCVYLGEAVRKVSFNSGFMAGLERAYIVSSNGNLSIINTSKITLEEAVNLDPNGLELDHVKKLDDQSLIVANSHGTVRAYSITELTLLLEISLEHRIKHIHLNNPNELILTHYNNTTGRLLLSEAKYQFLMRCHSDSITSLHYQQMYKRLVTTSDDGSIRIWRIFADNLSQQYQFQINDDKLTSLVVMQNEMTFVAGFKSGLLRRFDMKEFKLTQECEHHSIDVVAMDLAPQDNFILSGDRDGTVYLLSNELEVLCEYEATPQDNLQLGFNKRGDTFFITTTSMEVTIFSTRTLKPVHTFYIESADITKIIFSGDLLHIVTDSMHTIYRNYRFDRMFKLDQHSAVAVNFPLVVSCESESTLTLRILGSSVKEEVRVPERMGGIVLPDNDDESLLFAWGQASKAIYCWRLRTRNLPRIEEIPVQLPDPEPLISNNFEAGSDELNVTFMGQSGRTIQQPTCLEEASFTHTTFLQKPESPKSTLKDQGHLHVRDDQNEFLEVSSTKRPQQLLKTTMQAESNNGGHPIPVFIYGFPQSSAGLTEFIWNPTERYIVVASLQYIVVHFFNKPFHQKLIRLPYRPHQLKTTDRFLSFGNRNCISLYDIKSFTHFKSLTVEGEEILSYCFSNCSNYFITVSSHLSRRLLIAVMEVATSRLITQSYLTNGDRATVLVNPYSQRMEFVVLTAASLQYYRVTSIQTLEYQQLNVGEIAGKTNGLSAARFVKLESTELLLIGTVDGSLLIVDSRSATLLILCKSIVKSPITQIRFSNDGLLMLLSNTINIYIWKDISTLETLLQVVADKEPSVLPLDSPLSMVCQAQSMSSKLMVGTRLGVMWLIDPGMLLSIKVMCSHTKPINCLDLIDNDTMATGSEDSTAAMTCLNTLEQITSFYKPKKVINSLRWIRELDLLVVGHGNVLGFYTLRDVLGSCTLQSEICSIHHIANTRSILVGTRTEVLMIYLHPDSSLKIEVKKITEIKDHLLRLEVNPFEVYDSWLSSCRNGRINVWTRKCLKRLYNPVAELENIQELEYYLIDNYQPSSKESSEMTAHFVSAVSYLCLNHQTGRLQERNFKEHIILRDIVIFPACCFEISEDKLLLGTKAGELAVIDQNGLTISRQQLMQEGIRSIVVKQRKTYLLGNRVIGCHIG